MTKELIKKGEIVKDDYDFTKEKLEAALCENLSWIIKPNTFLCNIPMRYIDLPVFNLTILMVISWWYHKRKKN